MIPGQLPSFRMCDQMARVAFHDREHKADGWHIQSILEHAVRRKLLG
jgi:hypothetical protein